MTIRYVKLTITVGPAAKLVPETTAWVLSPGHKLPVVVFQPARLSLYLNKALLR